MSQTSPEFGLLLEGENALPVILHADHAPCIFGCLAQELFRERTNCCVRKMDGRAIGVLALRVVVEYSIISRAPSPACVHSSIWASPELKSLVPELPKAAMDLLPMTFMKPPNLLE